MDGNTSDQSRTEASRPLAARMPRASLETRDAAVIGTNSGSIVSKRSVERLYSRVPDDRQFLRYFVKKPQRRSPLINRGYWLRMQAVEHVVRSFLAQGLPPGKHKKTVVNLGCGYDPLPFQCLAKEKRNADVRFVDIDYPDLISLKSSTVSQTSQIRSLLADAVHHNPPSNHVHYSSREYLALGCDLHDLTNLQQLFEDHDLKSSTILFISEVSLTYIDRGAVDSIIEWAGKLPDVRFCVLEQLLPSGAEHPFARTMLKNFVTLGTPLQSVSSYPQLSDQVERFSSRGWKSVDACDWLAFWSTVISDSEKRHVESVEPFDEWEEFYLLAQHHFILYASSSPPSALDDTSALLRSTDNKAGGGYHSFPERPRLGRTTSGDLRIDGSFVPEFTASLALARRFGCAAEYGASSAVYCGGLGSTQRMDTSLLITSSEESPGLPRSHHAPSARVCHSMTSFGNDKILLVGGRTSPDKPLQDCYVLEKDRWRRVHDLPSGRYRHTATAVDANRILVYGGRGLKNKVLDEWLLWSEETGWKNIPVKGEKLPQPRFSCMLCWNSNAFGVLAGGLDERGNAIDGLWRVELVEDRSGELSVCLKWSMVNLLTRRYLWRRFGAQMIFIGNGRLLIVGGVSGGGLLHNMDEIVEANCDKITIHALRTAFPPNNRPLLIGHSVVCFDGQVVIIGGGGMCFCYGSCFTEGLWTLAPQPTSPTSPIPIPPGWRVIEEGKGGLSSPLPKPNATTSFPLPQPHLAGNHTPPEMHELKRAQIIAREDFARLVAGDEPVLLEGVDVGACVQRWTPDYLKSAVGVNRPVVVHAASSTAMSFHQKNFAYKTLPFGEFIDQAYAENPKQPVYLRSLSSANPSGAPADFQKDFPSIADDFCLPPALEVVKENLHSSPLRISSRDVGMWLHFDVMANVLCHVAGEKLFRLYPPTDVTRLSFPHGASSSTIPDIFAPGASPADTHPIDIVMRPGDTLFVPPLWPHAAKPLTPCIAVNVFWKNLEGAYATSKDVYGNRDLQAYENGRRAVQRIKREFEGLPRDVRSFYIKRLAQELGED